VSDQKAGKGGNWRPTDRTRYEACPLWDDIEGYAECFKMCVEDDT